MKYVEVTEPNTDSTPGLGRDPVGSYFNMRPRGEFHLSEPVTPQEMAPTNPYFDSGGIDHDVFCSDTHLNVPTGCFP